MQGRLGDIAVAGMADAWLGSRGRARVVSRSVMGGKFRGEGCLRGLRDGAKEKSGNIGGGDSLSSCFGV